MKIASPAKARSMMGAISAQDSAQTASKGRPCASGLSPRIGRKASLWSVSRSGPQTIALGKRDASIIPTAVLSPGPQPASAPSDVVDQSIAAIREAAAPPPRRK